MAIHITNLNGGDITVGAGGGSTPALPQDPSEGGFWTVSGQGMSSVKCSLTGTNRWEGSNGSYSANVTYDNNDGWTVGIYDTANPIDAYGASDTEGSLSGTTSISNEVCQATWSAT